MLGIVRPALGLRITPDVSVWAGYAWIPTYLDEGELRNLNEHRPWQQVLYQGSVGPLSLQFRPRFEQRVREGQSDVAFRLRFFGRFNARLTQRLPLWFASTDEVFVALNDAAWGPKAGYDQNRLFLGLGYGTSPRVEAGYLSVVIRKPSLLQVEDNVALNVFFNF
jgi:hypothetical protein